VGVGVEVGVGEGCWVCSAVGEGLGVEGVEVAVGEAVRVDVDVGVGEKVVVGVEEMVGSDVGSKVGV
jgi:hypothetical protein